MGLLDAIRAKRKQSEAAQRQRHETARDELLRVLDGDKIDADRVLALQEELAIGSDEVDRLAELVETSRDLESAEADCHKVGAALAAARAELRQADEDFKQAQRDHAANIEAARRAIGVQQNQIGEAQRRVDAAIKARQELDLLRGQAGPDFDRVDVQSRGKLLPEELRIGGKKTPVVQVTGDTFAVIESKRRAAVHRMQERIRVLRGRLAEPGKQFNVTYTSLLTGEAEAHAAELEERIDKLSRKQAKETGGVHYV